MGAARPRSSMLRVGLMSCVAVLSSESRAMDPNTVFNRYDAVIETLLPLEIPKGTYPDNCAYVVTVRIGSSEGLPESWLRACTIDLKTTVIDLKRVYRRPAFDYMGDMEESGSALTTSAIAARIPMQSCRLSVGRDHEIDKLMRRFERLKQPMVSNGAILPHRTEYRIHCDRPSGAEVSVTSSTGVRPERGEQPTPILEWAARLWRRAAQTCQGLNEPPRGAP